MILSQIFSESIIDEEDGSIIDMLSDMAIKPDPEQEKFSMGCDLVDIGEFAIFDEDDMFDGEKIEEIFNVNNNRLLDTGDKIPLVIGHTKDDVRELQQPEIVGYASKLSMGTIGALKPRKAIMAKFEIIKEMVDLVKKYPRRSVELWHKDLIIDPIALLGAGRPRKDLGLMTFSKSGDKITKYFEQGVDMAEMTLDKDTLVKLIVDTLNNSEIGQYVIAKMKQPELDVMQDAVGEEIPGELEAEGEEGKVPEGMETPEDEAAETPEEQAAEEAAGTAEHNPDAVPPEEENKEEKKANFEGAGGDNTAIPSALEKKKHEMEGMPEKYAEEVISRYKFENDNLKKQVVRYSREKNLLLLSQEFAFDVNDEIKYVEDFNDEQFNKHLVVIKTRYSKYPINRGTEVHPVKSNEGSVMKGVVSKDKVEKAITLAQREKCSFEEAMKRV